ncbi:MAG: HNH endonuclease signature motif containing protein [Planctomycetota bacterium]
MARRARTLAQRKPKPKRSKDWRPSPAARGYDSDWRRARNSYIADHPLCECCGKLAQSVDHRLPLSAGGARLDESNLRSLCEACHNAASANYRHHHVNEPVLPGRAAA